MSRGCTRRSWSRRSRWPRRRASPRSSARRGRSRWPSPRWPATELVKGGGRSPTVSDDGPDARRGILPAVSGETERPELSPEAQGTAPGRGRLEGRRIVVVGAGRMPNDDADSPPGNGQATSVLAAREGAAVAVVDVRPEAADETVALVEQEGGRAVRIVADVAQTNDCERLVDEANEALGGVDGVVCNVGIAGGMGLEGTTP